MVERGTKWNEARAVYVWEKDTAGKHSRFHLAVLLYSYNVRMTSKTRAAWLTNSSYLFYFTLFFYFHWDILASIFESQTLLQQSKREVYIVQRIITNMSYLRSILWFVVIKRFKGVCGSINKQVGFLLSCTKKNPENWTFLRCLIFLHRRLSSLSWLQFIQFWRLF